MIRVQHELEKRATVFNKELSQYLQGNHPQVLYEAARHLPLSGGKRLRPVLAMLSCESVGDNAALAMPFAVALELVHNFTLVHDDIMDRSRLRRNVPTVHTKYGEPAAILAGDLLFAKSFEAMHNLRVPPQVFKHVEFLLVKCIEDICEGQQLDMEFEKRRHVTETEYLEMIKKKTAVLFTCATQGGAMIGGGQPKEVQALTDYGTCLGLAFQIWDDYLDLTSNEAVLGKDIGNDIRNGKKTLIAVHALGHTSGGDKAVLDRIFGNVNASEAEVRRLLSVFRENQSIDYAKQTAQKYCEKAQRALTILRSSEAKEVLNAVAEYSIQRDK